MAIYKSNEELISQINGKTLIIRDAEKLDVADPETFRILRECYDAPRSRKARVKTFFRKLFGMDRKIRVR